MLVWCAILFIMGVLAFLDTMFNYGELFRRMNSVIFMLISFGLLIRISMKIKMRRFEGLIAKVEQLETELAHLRNPRGHELKPKETSKAIS